jgi:hypothetical protein
LLDREPTEAEELEMDEREEAALHCLVAAQMILGFSNIDFAWWMTLQAKEWGEVEVEVSLESDFIMEAPEGSC